MPRKKVGGEGDEAPRELRELFDRQLGRAIPTFDDVNDGPALGKIAAAFPGREVVGIDCEALVYGFGGIHCVTQQQPSATA